MHMRHLRGTAVVVCLVALAPLAVGAARAQDGYPSKPIRFVSPFSAGGSTDILARYIGQKFNEAWKQPVVVENRPGAGGNVGAEAVAKAPPDGYTLLLSASSVAINPSLYAKMTFDTAKDLAPVGLAGTAPNVLVVHPSLPARTMKEFIALARREPGALQYASGGNGTGSHLIAELFQHTANIRLLHVPYKGSGPATTALLSGECVAAFNNLIAAIPHIRAGKMRALALTSAERSSQLPDVPTVSEAGLPGFEADSWYGVFTTGGTPESIVNTLNRELVRVVSLPDTIERFTSLGITVKKMSAAEFKAFVASEMTKWAQVVKISRARVD
jgi:tripartite-type tricarboxylate transporter receptor subunit TctC